MSKYAKLVFLLVVSTLLVTVSFAGPAEAKKVVLRFGTVTPQGQPIGDTVEYFVRRVNELSNGEIEIKPYFSMALGGERDMAESTVFGELDFLYLSEGMLGNFVPGFKIFALPFLVKDFQSLDKFFPSPLGRKMNASASKKGLKHFWSKQFANRNPVNNVRPITCVADYKGLKIRTMENPIQMDTIKALGAMPTALPLPEAYPAFQTGVAEGSQADVAAIEVFKWGEVLKYVTLAPLFPCIVNLLGSQKVWDKLSPEHQQVIAEAAIATSGYFDGVGPQAELDYIEKLKKRGKNEFNTLDPAVYHEFTEALQPVYDKFLKQYAEFKPYVDWFLAY